MAVKIGLEMKLYRNTGSYGSPVWVEMDCVKDLTLNLEKAEADVTTRANAGWRATKGTLKDASLEFGVLDDPEDTNVSALRSAYFDGTALDLACLDGSPTAGDTQGVRFTGEVFNFSQEEPLEEAVGISVTIKPTYSDNAPEEWVAPT